MLSSLFNTYPKIGNYLFFILLVMYITTIQHRNTNHTNKSNIIYLEIQKRFKTTLLSPKKNYCNRDTAHHKNNIIRNFFFHHNTTSIKEHNQKLQTQSRQELQPIQDQLRYSYLQKALADSCYDMP